jgi:hypothetical protein
MSPIEVLMMTVFVRAGAGVGVGSGVGIGFGSGVGVGFGAGVSVFAAVCFFGSSQPVMARVAKAVISIASDILFSMSCLLWLYLTIIVYIRIGVFCGICAE